MKYITYYWVVGDAVFTEGTCGSLRCYMGEDAEVMRLVLRYSK